MDETQKKLATFVSSKDSRLACAAAVLLAEIAPRDPEMVKALVAGLETQDPVRRPFVIEALGRHGTAEAAAALVPLIKSEGQSAEMALRAIAHAPGPALKPLLKMLGSVPAQLLERVAECVARTGEKTAFAGLIETLATADTDHCRSIRAGVRTAMSAFDARAKENLHEQLDAAFRSKPFSAHQPALIALLKISGDLGDIRLAPHLLAQIDGTHPPHLRRSALQAFAMLHFSGPQRAKHAPKLLPLLSDSDTANIAEPALDAVKAATLNAEHHPLLRKLLGSPSSRIREFAMQALAQQGTSRTIHELIACLDSDDRSIREDALAALSRAPGAAVPLCERLMEAKSAEHVTAAARALSGQSDKIPAKLQNELAALYVTLSVPGRKLDAATQGLYDEKRRAIAALFRPLGSPALVEAVAQKARRLRADDPQRAYQLLREVGGLAGWNESLRIEAALMGIAVGAKDLGRSARSADPSLHALQDLLVNQRITPAELSKLVAKDERIDRRARYYLGFHFVERLQHEREFGRLILEKLSESKSEEGKLARDRLVLEGLVQVKAGKPGLLEERAKVLLAASDLLPSAPKKSAGKKAVKSAPRPAAKAAKKAPVEKRKPAPKKSAKPAKPVKKAVAKR